VLKLIFTQDSLEFEAVGTKIDRKTETIDINALPDIFTNVDSEEYELLSPLSAKAFIISDMRKMQFLEPDRFTNADDRVWDAYFFSTEPDGYFEGAHMDLSVIVPFSKEADNNEWQKSRLEKVKSYILKQIEG
jgi:poly-gamma-glutamate synthesis protein (capsule biosynthesis protein)